MNINILLQRSCKSFVVWPTLLSFILLFLLSNYCYSETLYQPAKEIHETKTYFEMIEKQRELQSFFPHRNYYNAKVYYDTAKYQLDEEHDKTLASFYAVLALVELKTMHTIAMTRKIKFDRLIHEKDQYKDISDKGTVRIRNKALLINSILKPSNGKFSCVIPEFLLFENISDKLSNNGIELLNNIGKVAAVNPSSRISIKGITKNKEKVDDAIEKTKKIASFLLNENRIGSNRIVYTAEAREEMLSIGNYKTNFNRIEIVVTGIR